MACNSIMRMCCKIHGSMTLIVGGSISTPPPPPPLPWHSPPRSSYIMCAHFVHIGIDGLPVGPWVYVDWVYIGDTDNLKLKNKIYKCRYQFFFSKPFHWFVQKLTIITTMDWIYITYLEDHIHIQCYSVRMFSVRKL